MLWLIPILILKIDFLSCFSIKSPFFFLFHLPWMIRLLIWFVHIYLLWLNWCLITIFKLIEFQQKIFNFFPSLSHLFNFKLQISNAEMPRRNRKKSNALNNSGRAVLWGMKSTAHILWRCTNDWIGAVAMVTSWRRRLYLHSHTMKANGSRASGSREREKERGKRTKPNCSSCARKIHTLYSFGRKMNVRYTSASPH